MLPLFLVVERWVTYGGGVGHIRWMGGSKRKNLVLELNSDKTPVEFQWISEEIHWALLSYKSVLENCYFWKFHTFSKSFFCFSSSFSWAARLSCSTVWFIIVFLLIIWVVLEWLMSLGNLKFGQKQANNRQIISNKVVYNYKTKSLAVKEISSNSSFSMRWLQQEYSQLLLEKRKI